MAGNPTWLDSVYQLKIRELREAAQSDFLGLLGEMRALNRPGADLTLLRRSAGKLTDAAVAQCEAAIPVLAEAHVKAGHRDVAVIAQTIQTRFVDVLLRGVPAASLYVSVRGGPPAVAEGRRLRQYEDVRFSALRNSLRGAVLHYVVLAVGDTPKPSPQTAPPEQDLRRFASAALAELYLATTNHFVAGRALRHRLRERVGELDARRSLAMSLVPELASRSGAGDDDYLRPTLACLVTDLPHGAEVVDAVLSLLRNKYNQQAEFQGYTWEELQAHCGAHAIDLPFSREAVVQIVSVAQLSSGWYGTHWGTPRDLEALLEVDGFHMLVRRAAARTPPEGEAKPIASVSSDATPKLLGPFDVAFSFPGSVRDRVEPVAEIVAQHVGRERVFYDRFYTPLLARPNLDLLLQDVYRERSRLLVVFIGQGYQEREWCGVEWRAIRDVIKSRSDDQVMLVRVDDAHVDGIFSLDGYVDLKQTTDSELAAHVLDRLASLPE